MPKAGDIYRTKNGHHVRIEQVRSSGTLPNGNGGGLSYALVRRCGAKGRTHEHPILKKDPITIYLMPDGSMPFGYTPTKETA